MAGPPRAAPAWRDRHRAPPARRPARERLAAEFHEQLHGSLRHLRLQDVANGAAYIGAGGPTGAGRVVQPRFTGGPLPTGAFPPRLVTDLYVLNPAEAPWRLFWAVATARVAVIGGGGG